MSTQQPYSDLAAKVIAPKHDLTKYIINYTDDIPDPVPVIMQGDAILFSRGNFNVVSGAPKSRKSMFIAALVASFYGNITFGLTSCIDGGICLLFDTESSRSHTKKQLKRIYTLLNWDRPKANLVIFHLRECSIEERLEIIKQAIEFYKPDWTIIDGLLDICNSANDDTETNLLILELMRITSLYNCAMTCILHTGKSNGANMLGWLGSYAQRKAETVFLLVKDGETTTVQPAETRNQPFDEFSFLIDNRGIPYYNGVVTRMTKSEITEYNMKLTFAKLLSPAKILDYTVLFNEYSEMAGCSERTAKNHISKVLKSGYLRKNDSGGYCLSVVQIE
jgi:hypothetical protein